MATKAPPVPPSGAPGRAIDRPSLQGHIEREISRLEKLVQPAPTELVDEAIELVLEGHGGRKTNETRAKAYCIALEGFSAQSIGKAVEDVLRHRVPDLDPDFPPTAPRLAAICRGHEDKVRLDLAGRRGELKRLLAPPEQVPSPEEEARIAHGLVDLGDRIRAAQREPATRRKPLSAPEARAALERRCAELGISPTTIDGVQSQPLSFRRLAADDSGLPSDVEPVGETPMTG